MRYLIMKDYFVVMYAGWDHEEGTVESMKVRALNPQEARDVAVHHIKNAYDFVRDILVFEARPIAEFNQGVEAK